MPDPTPRPVADLPRVRVWLDGSGHGDVDGRDLDARVRALLAQDREAVLRDHDREEFECAVRAVFDARLQELCCVAPKELEALIHWLAGAGGSAQERAEPPRDGGSTAPTDKAPQAQARGAAAPAAVALAVEAIDRIAFDEFHQREWNVIKAALDAPPPAEPHLSEGRGLFKDSTYAPPQTEANVHQCTPGTLSPAEPAPENNLAAELRSVADGLDNIEIDAQRNKHRAQVCRRAAAVFDQQARDLADAKEAFNTWQRAALTYRAERDAASAEREQIRASRMAETEALRAELKAARAALAKAAEQFDYYAVLHASKRSVEGYAKSATNREYAAMCRAAAGAPPSTLAPEQGADLRPGLLHAKRHMPTVSDTAIGGLPTAHEWLNAELARLGTPAQKEGR